MAANYPTTGVAFTPRAPNLDGTGGDVGDADHSTAHLELEEEVTAIAGHLGAPFRAKIQVTYDAGTGWPIGTNPTGSTYTAVWVLNELDALYPAVMFDGVFRIKDVPGMTPSGGTTYDVFVLGLGD